MSPAQAAQFLKISRRTIMRAIECQEILAFRDNKNHWRIDEAEIERWAQQRDTPTNQPTHDHPLEVDVPTAMLTDKVADLQQALAVAQAKIEHLQIALAREYENSSDLKVQRDNWHSAYLEATNSPVRKRRWWPW